MALVALAIAWAGRAAADYLGKHTPLRKSHGHYAKSFFRTGFDHIRNRLRTDPLEAIQPWHVRPLVATFNAAGLHGKFEERIQNERP